MVWEGCVYQQEGFTLPLAPVSKGLSEPHTSSSVSPVAAPSLSVGRLVEQLVHLQWTSPALTIWGGAYTNHPVQFLEGDSKHCPVCNVLVERCLWCTWIPPCPTDTRTAGTAVQAAEKAPGSWGWRWSEPSGVRAARRRSRQPHTSLRPWKETICLTSLQSNNYIYECTKYCLFLLTGELLLPGWICCFLQFIARERLGNAGAPVSAPMATPPAWCSSKRPQGWICECLQPTSKGNFLKEWVQMQVKVLNY